MYERCARCLVAPPAGAGADVRALCMVSRGPSCRCLCRCTSAVHGVSWPLLQVLVQMYERGEEPCVIGMYRKEAAGELCCHRRVPGSHSSQPGGRFGREDELRRPPLDPRVRARAPFVACVLRLSMIMVCRAAQGRCPSWQT